MNQDPKSLIDTLQRARAEVAKVLIGQREVLDLCLVTILCRSHALIEGVPGVAKTLLVRSLARVLGCEFSRVQFTPDLMPSDITGTSVFNLQKGEFHLSKGPIFTTFLLADEINRAPAKTQSALLQAMQEREVTIDNKTHTLSPHFTVFATQNPVEFEGTYPLPEAQKDRFMLRLPMGYPTREEELLLARETMGLEHLDQRLGQIQAVLTEAELPALRASLQGLTLREELAGYAVDIVRRTREDEAVLVPAGPRATQSLLLAARAFAAVQGRDFVTPDDIKAMAGPSLEHRLVIRPEFEIEQLSPHELVARVLEKVPVPR